MHDIPNQIHLDLAGDDFVTAAREVVRDGAVPAELQPAPNARRVMLDPQTHQFCLATAILLETTAG